jgi:hypothetical protein
MGESDKFDDTPDVCGGVGGTLVMMVTMFLVKTGELVMAGIPLVARVLAGAATRLVIEIPR